MIVVDVNLLIYAVNEDASAHNEAKAWLESSLTGESPIGLSWVVLLAFLRLVTRPGLFRKPLAPETAFDVLGEWLDQPNVEVLHPGPRHARILREILLQLGTGGNLTSDAHLAALAIEHNAELCSADGDFARFPGLQWRNPIKGGG